MSLHASENPPTGGRQALKIRYSPGSPGAAASILQALIQVMMFASSREAVVLLKQDLYVYPIHISYIYIPYIYRFLTQDLCIYPIQISLPNASTPRVMMVD